MFDHFIAVDWAMSNMAIDRMTKISEDIKTINVPSDIKNLQLYLNNLKGSKCLTFEETTTSHWPYTELREYVDKLIVCDPYRNRLLSEGPKTDPIDAGKLVRLLKAGLLKEVFHSNDKYIDLRKIVSAYDDLIKAGVRLKNQRSAIFRAVNINHKKVESIAGDADTFVLDGLDRSIEMYEQERERYKKEFTALRKKHSEIKRISDIPGIGDIFAVKIVSRIVNAKRFKSKNHFMSYCGLVKLEKMSGGRSYGKKNPRCCKMLKGVFKSVSLAAIGGNNPINDFYQYLLKGKKYQEHIARSATARKIAAVVYGVMKSGKKYRPYERKGKQMI